MMCRGVVIRCMRLNIKMRDGSVRSLYVGGEFLVLVSCYEICEGWSNKRFGMMFMKAWHEVYSIRASGA
jgi:hypothetical protein